MTTWTIKFETMSGETRTTKITAETLDAALDLLCQSRKVGNILRAHDGNKTRWL
jgi:hypothetical protein